MKLRTIIATAATAAVLASSGVAIAGATTSSDSHPTTPAAAVPATVSQPAARPALARRFRIRRRVRRLLKGAGGVVTKTIGIDRPTLRAELRSGKTIAQIATEHNVNPDDVVNALVAAADKKIDNAVTKGKVDSTRATRIEQRLPALITKLVNNWRPRHLRQHATG